MAFRQKQGSIAAMNIKCSWCLGPIKDPIIQKRDPDGPDTLSNLIAFCFDCVEARKRIGIINRGRDALERSIEKYNREPEIKKEESCNIVAFMTVWMTLGILGVLYGVYKVLGG